jgi:hypothetical protein
MEEMHVKTVHIDTSLQIERCKAPSKAAIVEKALQTCRFKSTSTYAKLEFKRAWLQRLAYIYSACSNVTRVDQLLGLVNDRLASHPMHARKLTTSIQAIETFLSRVTGSLTQEAQLVRFQSHVRKGIMGAYTWWDWSITHQYDGTECRRAREEPKESPSGKIDVSIPRCLEGKPGCYVRKFFEENKLEFSKLKKAIEESSGTISSEIKVFLDVINDALKDSRVLQDSKICSKIGDAIIAIDGLDIDSFAANNDKEWLFLARVFEKELLNPVRDSREQSPQL